MLITRQKFAEEIGVTTDTVEGWVRRGYVKCIKIGRRSLIDPSTLAPAADAAVRRADARRTAGAAAGSGNERHRHQ